MKKNAVGGGTALKGVNTQQSVASAFQNAELGVPFAGSWISTRPASLVFEVPLSAVSAQNFAG